MTLALEIEKEKQTAIDAINRLNRILIANKRYNDLERATNDTNYQKQLLMELLPSN